MPIEVLALETTNDLAAAEELLADGALGVNAAVKFSGISRSELYALMGDGELKFCKRGRRRLIPKRALVRFLADGLQGGGGADC